MSTEITEADFKAFTDLRDSAEMNMLCFEQVAEMADITEDAAKDIVSNFDKYAKVWPEHARHK